MVNRSTKNERQIKYEKHLERIKKVNNFLNAITIEEFEDILSKYNFEEYEKPECIKFNFEK